MSQEDDENGVNNPVSKGKDPGGEVGSLLDHVGLECSNNTPSGNNPLQVSTADKSLTTTQPSYGSRIGYASRAANESISSRSNMRQQILRQLEADSGIRIPTSSSSGWNQEASRSAAIASANPTNFLPNAGEVSLSPLATSSNHLPNKGSGRTIGVPSHVNEQNKHLLVPETSSARGGQSALGPNVNDRSLSSSSKKLSRLSGPPGIDAPGLDLRQRSNSNSIAPTDMPLLASGSFTPSSTTAGFSRSSNDATLSQIRNNDVASLFLPPQQQMYPAQSPGMPQQEPSFAPALGLPQPSSSGNNVSNRAYGSVASSWIPPPQPQQTLPSQPALQFRRPHLPPSRWPPTAGGLMAGVDPQQQRRSLELLMRSQQHRQTVGGIQHQEPTNFDNRSKNNNFQTQNYAISPSYLNNMEQIANTRPVQRRRLADGSSVAAPPAIPSSQMLYPQNFYLPSQQSHHLTGTGIQMPHNFGLPSANIASLSPGIPAVQQQQHLEEEQTKSKKSRRKPRIFKTFQERFDELIEYKREHGHCNVPRRYGPDKSLGVWCNNIRYSFRQLQGGKHPHNFISEEDIRRLDEIGFQWKLKSNPSSTDKSNPSSTDSAKQSVEQL